MKNIVVVGGGTAGWLTALYTRDLYPNDNITLIESEEIGILGAGEGSVPLIRWFLNVLDIDEHDLFKKCGTTFKTGVRFDGWNKENQSYYHEFEAGDSPVHTKNVFNLDRDLAIYENYEFFPLINAVANDKRLDDFLFVSKMAYKNKSPYVNFSKKIEQSSLFTYHFDAKLFANLLAEIGEERGIKRITANVIDVVSKENGDIESLILDKGKVDLDFVLDCSGFHRLLIGKHYNAKWHTYSDKLTVNTAIPFFLPMDDEIPPYTRAVAMKHGWMWMIPLQNRYGCGYIFDNNFTNVEEATNELYEYFGKKVDVIKEINFEAGRYDTPWINNCLAVGLSSTFSEPIEATSIWMAMVQLVKMSNINFFDINKHMVDEYNEYFRELSDRNTDFLQLHYFTNKDNTEFWKTYRERTTITPNLQKKLDAWKHRTPTFQDRDGIEGSFVSRSWWIITAGINLIDKEIYKKESSQLDMDNLLEKWKLNYNANCNKGVEMGLSHNEIINRIKNDTFSLT